MDSEEETALVLLVIAATLKKKESKSKRRKKRKVWVKNLVPPFSYSLLVPHSTSIPLPETLQ